MHGVWSQGADGRAFYPARSAVAGPGTEWQETRGGCGTLVPVPPELIVPAGTDASGSTQFNLPGGLGSAVLYGQWVVVDTGLPEMLGFSNAMRITLP